MNIIRLADTNDTHSLLKIYTPYVTETSISFETEIPLISEFQNRIDVILKKFPFIVYERDHQILGYAYASSHRSRAAYDWSVECSVYVEQGFHSQKIGTRLYQELFQLLKVQGVVNIYAGITLPNSNSVKIHENFNFTPIGIYKDAGFKQGKWWDVQWWQLQLQKPNTPQPLLNRIKKFQINIEN